MRKLLRAQGSVGLAIDSKSMKRFRYVRMLRCVCNSREKYRQKMHKITLSILLLFAHGLFFGQNHKKLRIQHLTDNFYVYTTYKDLNGFMFPSNSMYLVTGDGVVLFDTPWDTTQFQPLLDSISERHRKKVVLAISTHSHDDRTAGLEFLRQKGVKTYSSKLTYDLCKQHHEKQAEFYFEKDTVFSVGNYKFETYYPGEGHTKDNIVIWFEQHQVLYGGCLVKSTENKNLGNIADANVREWKPTIKRVIKKFRKPKFVIPGHFGWQSNKALEHTLKLLRKTG